MIAVRPRIVDDAIRGELSETEIVVSVRGGERALILNAIGDTVLDLCDGSLTVAEIAGFVRETLSVPDTVDVAADVLAVVEELRRAGVVEALE